MGEKPKDIRDIVRMSTLARSLDSIDKLFDVVALVDLDRKGLQHVAGLVADGWVLSGTLFPSQLTSWDRSDLSARKPVVIVRVCDLAKAGIDVAPWIADHSVRSARVWRRWLRRTRSPEELAQERAEDAGELSDVPQPVTDGLRRWDA